MRTYRSKVTVQVGGKIELCLDELVEGTEATIVVTIDDGQAPVVKPGEMRGYARGIYKSQKDVDDYLTRERDNWI